METIRETLDFKWTVSRGRDTYGYNICSLWINRRKVASCNGGGYDMQGTCLGQWLKDNFIEKLKKLKGNSGSGDDGTGFYGITFYDRKGGEFNRLKEYREGAEISLDGACGFDSMRRIAEAIGVKLEFVHSSTNETIYTAEYEVI